MRWLAIALVAACGGAKEIPPKDAPTDAPAEPSEQIHFYGRWDATQTASWPGSAIATRFTGTDLTGSFSDTGDDWLEITIDGVAQAPVHLASGQNDVPIASGLAAGDHDVVVVKRTESFVGQLRFAGFGTATLVASPRAGRTIEFIGDSITAGYGVLGTAPCTFSSTTEAETHAWGAYTAASLGVAHVAIAYSGIGMYRNSDGSLTNTMPMRYPRTLADATTSAWDFHVVPDVVVIALGTNDFGTSDPGTPFEDAYVSFVTNEVRAHAPSAPILIATSPMKSGQARTDMQTRLDNIIARLADPKIALIDLAQEDPADGTGCGSHPSETTQQKMAAQAVPAIQTLAAW